VTPLRQNIDLLQALPAMPKIAQEILSIKLATDRDDEMLLKLIQKDPAISARIIGLANSPLFGTSRKILTAHDAEAVLGIKRVKMVALSFAMISAVNRNQAGLLNVSLLWQHSMAVALAMDTLSKAMPQALRPSDEEIYLAGLLHDIGFLVLEYLDPDASNRLHARITGENSRSYTEIEAEMLEMNHCELGALLGEHWNLTANIIAVLRHHHSDTIAPDAVGQPLIAMTNLVEKILPTFGEMDPEGAEITMEEWQALGIPPERVAAVDAAMRKRTENIAAAIG
jgi:HD-like signal output (HDOD) protein